MDKGHSFITAEGPREGFLKVILASGVKRIDHIWSTTNTSAP